MRTRPREREPVALDPELFEELDVDGNGEIDYRELSRGLRRATASQLPHPEATAETAHAKAPTVPTVAPGTVGKYVDSDDDEEEEEKDEADKDTVGQLVKKKPLYPPPPSGPYVYRIPAHTTRAYSGYYPHKPTSARTI